MHTYTLKPPVLYIAYNTCVYIILYMFIHVCMYMKLCIYCIVGKCLVSHIHILTCTHGCTLISIYVHGDMCIYTCILVQYMYTCTHTCAHTVHTYVCLYPCTLTDSHIQHITLAYSPNTCTHVLTRVHILYIRMYVYIHAH